MARRTRKTKTEQAPRKHSLSPMSIPELKKTFDALDHATADILAKRHTLPQQVKEFQAVWRRLFGRPVERPAAEAYLQVKARGKSRRGTRKAQRGGAALAGAPLDFQTRPGIDGVHGSFPQYLTSGLSFYNSINQQAMFKDCGVKDITPAVPADLGSNKAQGGGGFFSQAPDAIFAIANRPFGSSSPPSVGTTSRATGRAAPSAHLLYLTRIPTSSKAPPTHLLSMTEYRCVGGLENSFIR